VLPADCVKIGVLPADCAKIGVLPADCVNKDLTRVPSAAMSMAVCTPAALPGLHECHVDVVCLTVQRLSLTAA